MVTICRRCGWRNEPTAVICGGCGQRFPLAMQPGADPDAITEPDLRRVRAAARSSVLPLGPANATWQGRDARAAAVRPRGGCCAARGLVFGGLAVLLVAIVAWITLLRPALHRQVDAALRSRMTALIAQVPAVDPGSYRVDAVSATIALQSQMTPGSPASVPTVHFTGGRVLLTFRLLGHTDSLSTALVAVGGRVVAQDTTVRGWSGLVESGPEMQSALDAALSALPASDHIDSISASDDILAVTVG